MHPVLNVAVRLLRKGGERLSQLTEQLGIPVAAPQQELKFFVQLREHLDQMLSSHLARFYPEHQYNPATPSAAVPTWWVEPLDASVNFERGANQFGLAAAMLHKGRVEVAAVYLPMRDELVTAVRGQGARINAYRLRQPARVAAAQKVLGIGPNLPWLPLANQDWCSPLFAQFPQYRCTGSTLTDLVDLVTGRTDALLQASIPEKIWPAAKLLLQEAGVLLQRVETTEAPLHQTPTLAASATMLQGVFVRINELKRASR